MIKILIYTSIASTSAYRSLHSRIKKCFVLMTALFAAILLGVLVTSCGIYIGSGPSLSSSPQPSASTSLPGEGSTGPGPIAEGDFLDSSAPITGPTIVEFWNGLGGANKVCGTFQLPYGESFSYKAGHWWKYKSDQDMHIEWPLHVKLYHQKPENTGCTNGQRPPS